MAETTIEYNGENIASLTEGQTAVIDTDGHTMEGNIVVTAGSGSGGGGSSEALSVRTINGTRLKFFVGTKAEYDALADDQKQGLFAIISDDATKEAIMTALAGHTTAIAEHTETLAEHAEDIEEHTEAIDRHTEAIDGQAATLAGHTSTLAGHTSTLGSLAETLTALNTLVTSWRDSIDPVPRASRATQATKLALGLSKTHNYKHTNEGVQCDLEYNAIYFVKVVGETIVYPRLHFVLPVGEYYAGCGYTSNICADGQYLYRLLLAPQSGVNCLYLERAKYTDTATLDFAGFDLGYADKGYKMDFYKIADYPT